jgi:pilus assembly protein Flp/PilA
MQRAPVVEQPRSTIYMRKLFHRLRREEKGAALVEYGMLVGLIAVICVVAVTTLGTEVSAAFSNIASALSGI